MRIRSLRSLNDLFIRSLETTIPDVLPHGGPEQVDILRDELHLLSQ